MGAACQLPSSKIGKGTQQTSMRLKRHSIIVHGATAKRGSANTPKTWKPRRPHNVGAAAMRRCSLGKLALVMLSGTPAQSAPQVTPNGFPVKFEVSVNAPAAKVYDALVGQIGSWWASEHTYSGDAKNLTIDARPGGCFCEKLPNGGGIEHARVIYVAPREILRLSGALGPLQTAGGAGTLIWQHT